MRLLFLITFLSINARGANFIHVLDGEIVQKYQAEEPTIFGGPWSQGVSFNVGALDLAKVRYEDGEFYEDEEMTEQEIAAQKEKF